MRDLSIYKKIVWIAIAVIGFIWMMVSTVVMVMTQRIWWILSACGSLYFEINWMDVLFDD